MPSKRNKTNYTGVYAREHESRRYRGKPDVCYDICFRLPGERKLIWEKVGWLSEKVTASMASHVRAERLKHARKVDNLPADNARLTLDEVFERFRTDYLEVMRKRPMDAVHLREAHQAEAWPSPTYRNHRRGSGRIAQGRVAPVSAIHTAHLEPPRPDIPAGGAVGLV